MEEEIIIKSHWNVNISCRIISQKSDTLAVLIPGTGYTVDRPLLDYSKKLTLELGYDVLPIEYGFQLVRKKLNIDEELKYIEEESLELFKEALKRNYKRIVFISKSVGTIVHTILCNEVKEGEVKNIYLTPVNYTMNIGIKENSLVVSGTSDPLRSEETIEKIKSILGVNLLEIENADHSLNVEGDTLLSIKNLQSIIGNIRGYLIN